VLVVLSLGIRRWFNRATGGIAAKRTASEGGAVLSRPPTARRRLGMGGMMVLVLLAILGQVVFSMYGFLGHARTVAEDRPPVSDERWQAVQELAFAGGPGWRTQVSQQLASDTRMQWLSADERQRYLDAALAHVDRLAAPGGREAVAARTQQRLVGLVALLFALIAACSLCLGLGLANADLAKPDWDELWLAAQPISNRVIFAARLVQYAVISPLVWMLVPASVAVAGARSGLDWRAAIALGLVVGLAWTVVAGAVRLLAETWLRQHLAHARIKNLQAVCTVFGMAAMVAMYAVAFGRTELPQWYVALAEALPWHWLPPGWAAGAAMGHGVSWLLAGCATAVFAGWVSIQVCARWSQGGLLVHDGTLAGRRASGGAAGRWRAFGVLGKDLVLIGRDRALLVQALIMPLFMIGLQLAINPSLGKSALSSVHAAATSVVALGGWVLMSATAALAFEGQALWILAGAPMPLADAIRGKVVMWAAFATGYAVLGLGAVLVLLPWPGPTALGDVAMVLAGMPLLAALAVGIGAAATDPQATVATRKVGIGATYLYMLVLGLFSVTVNLGGVHERLAMLFVLAVVAWAMWQRLRNRLVYIFEPVDRPPRQVDLADGAWAAFAFLVLQGLIGAALIGFGTAVPTAIAVAFGLAGLLTASGAVLSLWRARVPGVLRAVGILPPPGSGLVRTLGVGGLAGALAATGAALYLAALPTLADWMPGLRSALDEVQGVRLPLDGWLLVVLTVGLAPLCEEFIFRGLLFRGLRRDLAPLPAALLSAAVFAVIHPSLGMLPVFGLGFAAALAYERTGWLLAPIAAHALYNAVVVLAV
jgi:membrane protease YdiL (CAAX protease family)